ncbi:MAG: acyl-CoA thioesterase [Planctomycetota bacterium]
MAHRFAMTRRVTFAETDMAGILHFSNYFRYMEETEHAFFRSLGFQVHACEQSGAWGWARRNASCDYQRPLRYEDEVELQLTVKEKRSKALVYEVRFVLDGELAAQGELTAVCVEKGPDGRLRAAEMPAVVAAAIDVAPLT